MRQSSHSCLGLVFTLFDPPFNCPSSCCKDQFAVLYLIQTVKLVINVVIEIVQALFTFQYACALFDTCFTQTFVVLFHGHVWP